MSPRDCEQVQALLAAGARDELTLRILLQSPDAPLESMLFHAQQAIEKGIKAALVGAGVIFPRTHDLLELSALGQENGLLIPAADDLLLRLAPYAVEFRYLSAGAPTVIPTEAHAAVVDVLAWAALCAKAPGDPKE